MPVDFPTLDPESGDLVPTPYYTVGEVAELLHVSHWTVRDRLRRGEWPHLTIAGSHYLSGAMVADVVALCTVDPRPQVEDCPAPPKLGTPVQDHDLEGFR
jgi:excisionase family DNA binding protein